MRIWPVGTGTVGRWLLREFADRAAELERHHAFAPTLVGVSKAAPTMPWSAGCDLLGEVMLRGPGAGPELAGQGLLSDAIALAARRG